jgi:hypothetical protein
LASEPLMQFLRLTAGAPRRRAIDAATVEAAAEFASAGITVVLLKGPVTVQWLYGDGEPRWYADCDLLLPEADLEPAGAVLTALGYSRRPRAPEDPALLGDEHSVVWFRARDEIPIELHWTLVGLEASHQATWELLSRDTLPVTVNGLRMRSLGEPGRALHLALHLAQHGATMSQAGEDLRRGIATLNFEVWTAARELSARLGSDSAFGAGLRACPGGDELAERLQLPPATLYWTLRAQGAPRGALRLHMLTDAAGWRERWEILGNGLSRYREFSEERRQLSGLARLRASVSDLIAALRAVARSRN